MKAHSTEECPVAKVAALLSDTWTMLIVRDVMRRPMRFCELESSLSGISTRTLTLKLKKLAEDGIIVKKESGYAITLKGKKLGVIFDEMTRYGKRYLKN